MYLAWGCIIQVNTKQELTIASFMYLAWDSYALNKSGSTAGSHGSNVEPEVLYCMHILHLSLAKVSWTVDA